MSAPARWQDLLSAAALWLLATAAQAEDVNAQLLETPLSVQMGFDAVHFQGEHGRERLGLVSTALLFETLPDWWFGPAVVGAGAGQRGGFFVFGGQAERRWRLGDAWRAQAGLMVGGGGGGGAPVGGGLMLKPSLGLLYDWGPVQTGLNWSSVNMPSGRIGSRQIGLVLNWDGGRYRYFDAADAGRASDYHGRTGLGIDRLMLTGSSMHVQGREGLPASTVKLLGVRAERQWGQHVYWGVESAAAAHGGADGYMELLGTGGLDAPLGMLGLDDLHVGARAAVGLGGGGAVATGGGALLKLAGGLRWDWGRHAFVGFEAGALRAGRGDFQARYAQWQLGWQLDRPASWNDRVVVDHLAWSTSVEHVAQARRKDGRKLDLETIGFKLKYMLGEYAYATGQAHTAVAGQAGAYSAGMAGLGWQLPLGRPEGETAGNTAGKTGLAPWHLAAELTAGAAGGGGVATQGGAIAQGMLYLGGAVGASSDIQIGAGRIRGRRGGLDSTVLDISFTQHFGSGRR